MLRSFFSILILFICFQSCQFQTEKESRILSNETINTTKLEVEQNEILLMDRDSTNAFLDNPFDLFQFKQTKKMSNSGGGKHEDYYLKPKKEGMYYRYFLFSNLQGYLGTNKNKIILKENGLAITVYKELGIYRYEYIDTTEQIIEVKAQFNDFDLPELALVVLDSLSIIKKFGKPDFIKINCLVYEHNNKVLVLKLDKKRVVWLKYISLKKGLDILKADNVFKY